MNTDERRFTQNELNKFSEMAIGCAFKVHNVLGCGFLEKVYENALVHEIGKNVSVEQQKAIQVVYDGIIVGDYVADILIDSAVILELKAAKEIDNIHQAQILNYLKATSLNLGLILNFGQPKLQIKRIVRNF
ncbi:GxxExxY protein [Desulfococcaceae bacterium HSG8]|nr:GxxExxY protein [Desulfococcaceae bacterium HSG8]